MNSELGKLTPQAPELEESVLGAILIESKAIEQIISFMDKKCFYSPKNLQIYEAIQDLYSAKQPIDILTVVEKLKSKGKLEEVGGMLHIAKLSNKIASAANIEAHARIVFQKYIQRSVIEISSNLIKEAYTDTLDVFELLDLAERSLTDISVGIKQSQTEKLNKLIVQYYEDLYSPTKISGVKSGFYELDRIIGGWQKSDLIILAARPGMGKTAIAINFAEHAGINDGKRVLVFSLEMSKAQLTQRIVSSQTEVLLNKLKHKSLNSEDEQKLSTKIDEAIKSNIYINDEGYCDISFIKSTARRMHAEQPLDFIIIDYLQLINGSKTYRGNREQEISEISRNLKGLAKELNIPIIALSQLSRACEARSDKMPQLSDLRESGAIEQDADIVLFLMRPDYYGIKDINVGNETIDSNGLAIVDIAKHRNGSVGKVIIKSELWISRFKDRDSVFG
jgi:replicative DNA helicase